METSTFASVWRNELYLSALLPPGDLYLSALLPPEARLLLARAAGEARQLTDDLAREIHLAEAIARVRIQFPSYFK